MVIFVHLKYDVSEILNSASLQIICQNPCHLPPARNFCSETGESPLGSLLPHLLHQKRLITLYFAETVCSSQSTFIVSLL